MLNNMFKQEIPQMYTIKILKLFLEQRTNFKIINLCIHFIFSDKYLY